MLSKDPSDAAPWERDEGWRAAYRVDGAELRGGCGVVLPVIHIATGERRALKQPMHGGDELRARFKSEISIQRAILHPNRFECGRCGALVAVEATGDTTCESCGVTWAR